MHPALRRRDEAARQLIRSHLRRVDFGFELRTEQRAAERQQEHDERRPAEQEPALARGGSSKRRRHGEECGGA
jgi:hypothetical protein